MKKSFSLYLFLFSVVASFAQRFNEFHYDNTGGDVGEFIEVFIPDPQPANIGAYDIRVYNGLNGMPVSPILDFNSSDLTMSCAGVDAAGVAGVFYQFDRVLQNDVEGFVLEDDMNNVLQFISYEGTFTATGGAASGLTSVDVGVSESDPGTPIGSSIEFDPILNQWIIQDDDTPCAQNALPVEMLYFDGEIIHTSVKLTWATASEVENDYFQIEHSSNGINFSPIEKITGAGTTFEKQFYEFNHKQPLDGSNFYRLKQVDFDGVFEYSEIKSVSFKKPSSWRLFPTQSNEGITVDWSSNFSAKVISIFDINGKMVFSKRLDSEQKSEYISIANFPSGSYFLKMQSGRSISTKRFFKLK